ncbi:hypothetical protein AB28_4939 [Raoultella ornithinolytica 2-156-04_S1_C2]|nr:hypothetical protein AB00_4716 [Raoultella ornithinolytica 2-156-04_S1_C1]KDX09840.1 hypothetical protein AB28_4939 [Raoultella ornithinolytica 2-156-04_S1_C2]
MDNHNASLDAVQIGRKVEDFIFMLDYRWGLVFYSAKAPHRDRGAIRSGAIVGLPIPP